MKEQIVVPNVDKVLCEHMTAFIQDELLPYFKKVEHLCKPGKKAIIIYGMAREVTGLLLDG